MTIESAFLIVVTVTATVAPHIRTNVNTACNPMYPLKLNRNIFKYIVVGDWKDNKILVNLCLIIYSIK